MRPLYILPALLLCAAWASPADREAAAVRDFVANPTSLRTLLETRQYEKLENALTAIERATKGRYDQENVLWAAYQYLAQPRAENEKLFDEWLTKSKNSIRARLAKAIFLKDRGWRSRGAKWSVETEASQFRGMEEYHAAARREYLAVVAKDPGNLVAYAGLISLCMNEGKTCSSRWVEQALAHDPGSFNIRAAHLYVLRPRWGGSYEAMAAFAADAQKHADENPRLRHLLGSVDAERAFMAGQAARWPEAVMLYTEAMKHGPDPVFLGDRAFALLMARKPALAAEDVRAARAASPVGWFYSEMRLAHTFAVEGSIAYGAGDKATARKSLARACEIEVDNAYLLDWKKTVEK